MKNFYCDECETEIEALLEPEHITDGDHYWCNDCWADRRRRLAEAAEEIAEDDGDRGPT